MDHAEHKVWDDAKPLEQKFPGALLELWKMREAKKALKDPTAQGGVSNPDMFGQKMSRPHWLQAKGHPDDTAESLYGNPNNLLTQYSRKLSPAPSFFALPQILREAPIRHAEFLEAAARPKLNAAQIKMLQKFDPEGDGYDYATAKAHGISPDERGKWQSRSLVTGQLLKGRKHKSWKETLEGEAKAGYTIYKDPASGKYYSTPRHAKGPLRANIFTGLSGLAQEMQNR